MLNGRVRNGNGWGHPGMVTGNVQCSGERAAYSAFCLTPLLGVGKERINAVKRLAVSTGRLRRLPALHVRPIDPVVFREPSSCDGRPRLAEGFTLRCLQRLSVPYVATLR